MARVSEKWESLTETDQGSQLGRANSSLKVNDKFVPTAKLIRDSAMKERSREDTYDRFRQRDNEDVGGDNGSYPAVGRRIWAAALRAPSSTNRYGEGAWRSWAHKESRGRSAGLPSADKILSEYFVFFSLHPEFLGASHDQKSISLLRWNQTAKL